MNDESKISVLFVTTSVRGGGEPEHLYDLARGLKSMGHSVSIAVPYSISKREEEYREMGIPVHILIPNEERAVAGSRRWFNVYKRGHRLRRLVRESSYDIIFGYSVSGGVYSVVSSILFGIPIVTNVHTARPPKSYISSFMEQVAVRGSALVICAGSAAADAVESRRGSLSKIRFIDNGSDLNRFRPDEAQRCSTRSDLQLERDAIVLGWVGRIVPIKNPEGYLQTLESLVERGVDVFGFIVGAGPSDYVTQLKDMARDMGLESRVRWVDAVPDPERYYNAMDMLLTPSHHGEAMPYTRIEAMASGKPVVTSRSGNGGGMVGSYGLVVDENNPEEIADAVEYILQHPEEFPAEQIRQYALGRYSVERMVDEYERLLMELVEPNGMSSKRR